MDIGFMPRGTLARLSREKNLVSDMLLLEHKPNGYTEDELTSVRVVTLQEYAHECATRKALLSGDADKDLNLVGASDRVDKILREQFASMKEFVSVNYEGEILIAVDKVTIDDAAVTYALELLFNIDSAEPGTYKDFGEWISL